MDFSLQNEGKTKLISSLSLTMDYDSGYMSHNPESNLDSSIESNSNEKMLKSDAKKPIYLSEDALLEKPEIKNDSFNLSLQIENENYEETRNLFYSPEISTSETAISDSVVSQETNYSGFNDSELENSISPIIPLAKPLVVDIVSIKNSSNCIYIDERDNHTDVTFNTTIDENNFSGKLDKQDVKTKLPSALANITNTFGTNNSNKKLTLIFSRENKENYSVKRKFPSISPKLEKSFVHSDHSNINSSLEESYLSEGSPEKNSLTETEKSVTLHTESDSNIDMHISCIEPVNDENRILEENINEITENNKYFLELNSIEISKQNYNPYILLNNLKLDYGYANHNSISPNSHALQNSSTTLSKEQMSTNLNIAVNMLFENVDSNTTTLNENEIIKYVEEKSANNTFIESVATTAIKEEIHKNVHLKEQNVLTYQTENNSESLLNISENSITNNSTVNNTSNESLTITTMKEEICKITVKNEKVVMNQINNTSQSLLNLSEVVVNNNFELPEIINISATPTKKFKNPIDPNISPDLFDEEETVKLPSEDPMPASKIAAEKYIIKKDYTLMKRAYNSLKGVLPPHSVTVIQMSVDEMLNKIEANKSYFWDKEVPISTSSDVLNTNTQGTSNSDGYKSLLISEQLETNQKKEWPAVLEGRCLGIHYNRSKLSEQFEELCSKYAQRYVGAETQSSCTSFKITNSSPLKRKQIKQRWSVKSPGRRLSHLARRRITFSSASLQASSSFAGSRARQILVDAKKLELLKQKSPRKSPRKTPKKTPSKSPRIKTRTPSSSAKKKLAMRFRKVTGEIETTGANSNSGGLSSKRALFHSPSRDKSSLFAPSTSGVSAFESESKKPTKRALFMSPSKKSPMKNSPFKRSPFKRLELGTDRKRKRNESEDNRPTKLSRTVSEILKSSDSELKTIDRKSTFNISLSQGQIGELSAAHKKKLQWAVYEALRAQDVTPSHPQFKLFASILARVTRRILPYVHNGISGKEIGTSERMLRITRYHVFSVIKGKSVDEIVNEYLRNRAKQSKPQGYIGIEEFNSAKKKENVLQDRSNMLESLEKNKLDNIGKSKASSSIDRIRKVINFGDDDNR